MMLGVDRYAQAAAPLTGTSCPSGQYLGRDDSGLQVDCTTTSNFYGTCNAECNPCGGANHQCRGTTAALTPCGKGKKGCSI